MGKYERFCFSHRGVYDDSAYCLRTLVRGLRLTAHGSPINTGLVFWKLESPWWGVVVAVAVGGTIGSLIGKAMARMLYSARGDQLLVVKAGPAGSPKTLVASLLGAIAATALLGFGAAAVLGGLALVKSIALISAVSAALVGVLWGILSALL